MHHRHGAVCVLLSSASVDRSSEAQHVRLRPQGFVDALVDAAVWPWSWRTDVYNYPQPTSCPKGKNAWQGWLASSIQPCLILLWR